MFTFPAKGLELLGLLKELFRAHREIKVIIICGGKEFEKILAYHRQYQ